VKISYLKEKEIDVIRKSQYFSRICVHKVHLIWQVCAIVSHETYAHLNAGKVLWLPYHVRHSTLTTVGNIEQPVFSVGSIVSEL